MVKKTSISKLSQVIQNIESLRSSLQSEREKEGEDQRKLKKLSAELEAAEKRSSEGNMDGFPSGCPALRSAHCGHEGIHTLRLRSLPRWSDRAVYGIGRRGGSPGSCCS
ncbi:hypothetical protein Dimus_016354 [Dionaea muscipula]